MKMKNKNIELRKVLIKIGISSNVKGFYYILDSVEIIKKQKIHTNVTTIYEMLSKKYGASPSSIERSIRHAIQQAYKSGEILKKIYNTSPDNSVLIYDLYFNFDIIEGECE